MISSAPSSERRLFSHELEARLDELLFASPSHRSIERLSAVPEIAWCSAPAVPALPRAALVNSVPASALTITAAPPREGERPLFMEVYERYDWLLKNGATTAEDKTFMADYEKTKEYRMLYRSYNS